MKMSAAVAVFLVSTILGRPLFAETGPTPSMTQLEEGAGIQNGAPAVPLVEPVSIPNDRPVLQMELIPQKIVPMGPRATGLLVQEKFAGLCSFNPMEFRQDSAWWRHDFCFRSDGNPYVFYNETSRPFWVTFPSPNGDGYNVWYGFAQFGSETPNPWGLRAEAHLVDLNVDGGSGADSAAVEFRGDDVKILDHTPKYPLDVAKALHFFLDAYGDPNSAISKKISTQFDIAVKQMEPSDPYPAHAGAGPANPDNSDHLFHQAVPVAGFHVEWSTASETMRVVFYRRLEDTFTRSQFAGCRTMPRDPYPPCTPTRGHRCEEDRHSQCDMPVYRERLQIFGAEFGASAEFSKQGFLLKRAEYPIDVYIQSYSK